MSSPPGIRNYQIYTCEKKKGGGVEAQVFAYIQSWITVKCVGVDLFNPFTLGGPYGPLVKIAPEQKIGPGRRPGLLGAFSLI